MRYHRLLQLTLLGLLLTGPVSLAAAQPVPLPTGPVSKKDRLAERDRWKAESASLAAAGKLTEAAAAAEKALAATRDLFGSDGTEVVDALRWLAQVHEARTDWPAARQAREDALALQLKRYGAADWRVTDARLALAHIDRLAGLSPDQRRRLYEAARLQKQVVQLFGQGRAAEALPDARRSLDIRKEILGETHPLVADSLNNLALLHDLQKDRAAAVPLLRQALQIREQAFGRNHPKSGDSLHNLGVIYKRMGKLDQAEPPLRQALEVRGKALGEKSREWALTLAELAQVCREREELAQAEPLYRRLVEVRRQTDGPGSVRIAETLSRLGWIDRLLGEARKAEPLFREALEIYSKARGKDHPESAEALRGLAGVCLDLGDYAQAEPLYQRLVALQRSAVGEDAPAFATALNDLASLHADRGDYGQAETLYRRALDIRRRALGAKHLRVVDSLNNLGILYKNMQQYDQARPLFRQALQVIEVSIGKRHRYYANMLNNLAVVCADTGDYAQAEPLLRQALDIQRAVLGEGHPECAATLSTLAALYQQMGDLDRAEPLYRQVLAIRGKALGERDPQYSATLVNLGMVEQARGHSARAEELLRQAVDLRRQTLGEKHPGYADCLLNLATVYRAERRYDKAESLVRSALEIYGQALGEEHLRRAVALNSLAAVYREQDQFDRAAAASRQAVGIVLRVLRVTAGVQSERQQLAMLRSVRVILDDYLSLPAAAGDGAEQVYAPVLVWKGMVLARQRHIRAARRLLEQDPDPAVRRLYDELETVSRHLAALALAPVDAAGRATRGTELARLTRERERLEGELAGRSAGFRAEQELDQLTPARLRQVLPPEAALIDFLGYQHVTRSPKGGWLYEPRLTAFVLRRDRPIERVDLGPAAPVTTALDAWRARLLQEGPAPAGDSAAELRRLVWQPLEAKLEGARAVLISPDGALGRLPFAALPGRAPGTYLIEERAVAVVPVPRLLPEWLGRPAPAPQTGPSLLVVGDVDYGAAAGDAGLAGRSAPAAARAGTLLTWPALLWTGTEARAVEQLFCRAYPDGPVRLLSRAEATEGAVRAEAPTRRYLHFATHGFFAPPPLRSALAAEGRGPRGPDLFVQQDVAGFHPGLLSGLVLAGANHPPDPGRDDGILTALEVAALDLGKVDVAVLSACETGLGEAAGGEGLLGLQRAFQVAGARSVVASLWQVDDRATQKLMRAFYDNLWNKKLPRLEALRQAQLALLHGDDEAGAGRGPDLKRFERPGQKPARRARQRPALWAAWVLSGDPGDLSVVRPSGPPALLVGERAGTDPRGPSGSADDDTPGPTWPYYLGGVLGGLTLAGLAARRIRRRRPAA